MGIGFRAPSTEREQGQRETAAIGQPSLSLVADGPIIGLSFRF
jgi:hypothetical protein